MKKYLSTALIYCLFTTLYIFSMIAEPFIELYYMIKVLCISYGCFCSIAISAFTGNGTLIKKSSKALRDYYVKRAARVEAFISLVEKLYPSPAEEEEKSKESVAGSQGDGLPSKE